MSLTSVRWKEFVRNYFLSVAESSIVFEIFTFKIACNENRTTSHSVIRYATMK